MDKPKPAPEPAVPDMHRRVPQYLVRRVAQICNAIQSEAYADHGLMPWQFAVLMQVRSRPGMDRNWHAAAAGCDATSVGQTLERWVSQGLAVRGINPLDRRAGAYSLTPEGHALAETLLPRSRAATRQILSPLDEDEARVLMELLARLVDAHEAHARPGAGRRPPRKKPPNG